LNPRELTDTTLARQAKALTQIGEIRVAQLRYPEAAAAFAAAYDRAETLAARHPRNGEMLFERAQAEYWIGFVHWRRRDLAAASTWLVRYRDSGAALQQLGPANLRWQREAISGQHNLAVLEVERGNLGTAREGFLAELAAVQRLQAAAPDDLNLQFRVADAESWLGSVAEREGALAEAVARFGSQVERLRRISDKDPGTARWRQRLADAMGLQTVVLSVSGRRAEALALSRQTLEILEALAKKDRENRDWRRAAANSYVREAMFVGTGGDWAAALTRLREVRTEVEEPARAESSDWAAVALLAYARRLEARALMELNRVPEAREAAARAVETLGSLKEGPRLNEATRAEFAQACLVAGSVAQRTGDASAARRHWELGWEAVREPAGTSRFWKVLDPAARLLLHLGRSDEGRRIIERLSASSYQPLEPWP
jgi:serine/threonine-protein kinase